MACGRHDYIGSDSCHGCLAEAASKQRAQQHSEMMERLEEIRDPVGSAARAGERHRVYAAKQARWDKYLAPVRSTMNGLYLLGTLGILLLFQHHLVALLIVAPFAIAFAFYYKSLPGKTRVGGKRPRR